ncbi:MAG: polysaccharide biosynthesis C-terminal domain-containing protein [Myxococcota bacterium]|nr:polysaccharide biosynthesis C-terminal domain-containing protein [Myxococcota bacterium]
MLNYALSWFLVARGRERPYLGIVVLMTIVNVCVNLVTVPRWGGPGAAWATLLSEATLSVCCLAVLGKER